MNIMAERAIPNGLQENGKPKIYVVYRFCETICIARWKNNPTRPNGIGTQFEQFLSFPDEVDGCLSASEGNRFESITFRKVGDRHTEFGVLFVAELDGQVLDSPSSATSNR